MAEQSNGDIRPPPLSSNTDNLRKIQELDLSAQYRPSRVTTAAGGFSDATVLVYETLPQPLFHLLKILFETSKTEHCRGFS